MSAGEEVKEDDHNYFSTNNKWSGSLEHPVGSRTLQHACDAEIADFDDTVA